jgi:hypothetical protein
MRGRGQLELVNNPAGFRVVNEKMGKTALSPLFAP